MITKRHLGPPGHHYATVWKLRVPLTTFSLRLHHWYGSDDCEAFHSHPQWFFTWVLWGAYADHYLMSEQLQGLYGTPASMDFLGWLSWRVRPAAHRHYVVPTTKHVWTLLLFGGKPQRWDFWRRDTGRRVKRDKYFAQYGHHTATGVRVRMRPDGSVIEASPDE